MRSRLLSFLLLAAVVLSAAAPRASALILPVTGGPGLDQGEICPSGSLCPGTPAFSLIGTAPVIGSFTYNSGPSTVDFVLTLTSNANFGGALLLAGSTVSALGVPVLATPLGGGALLLSQFGLATGLVVATLVPAFPLIANTPAVSALSCTVGTGADQCGVSVGPGGLTIAAGSFGNFDAFLTFNVNVPEPGTLLLVAAGLMGLGVSSRKRA